MQGASATTYAMPNKRQRGQRAEGRRRGSEGSRCEAAKGHMGRRGASSLDRERGSSASRETRVSWGVGLVPLIHSSGSHPCLANCFVYREAAEGCPAGVQQPSAGAPSRAASVGGGLHLPCGAGRFARGGEAASPLRKVLGCGVEISEDLVGGGPPRPALHLSACSAAHSLPACTPGAGSYSRVLPAVTPAGTPPAPSHSPALCRCWAPPCCSCRWHRLLGP